MQTMATTIKTQQLRPSKLIAAIIFGVVSSSTFTHMPSAVAQTTNKSTSTPVGTNLYGIVDWSTQLPFIDAFKSSRPWITQTSNQWNTNERQLLNLDKDGWVKSLPAKGAKSKYTHVGTLLFREIPNRFPGGKYIVLYDGQGTINYGFAAKKIDAESKPGRDVIQVNSAEGSGIYISITATNPNNYIRNIRVIPEKYAAQYQKGEIFNPAFLDKIKNFKVLRFMDWMQTNNSQQQAWVNRPTQQTATYSLKGAPVEVMVALSNRVKADPWFNMPHMANDEYVTKFAQVVKQNLNQGQKVYVEYSNEVWNTQFEQAKWAAEQGKKDFKTNADDNTLRMNWHGKRTAQICDIWKRTFGNQSNRVVCVLGAQAVNTWTAAQALDTPLWKGRPSIKMDAIAIAPYFGYYLGDPKNQNQVQSWNTDKVFQEINQGGALTGGPSGGAIASASQAMKDYAAFAKQKNISLIAYEGGQHLVGHGGVENNQTITNLLIAANRDKRMYDAYSRYLNEWKNAGGGLFMHFSDTGVPSKWGSWGALEYIDQNGSPKYNALMDFIRKNP